MLVTPRGQWINITRNEELNFLILSFSVKMLFLWTHIMIINYLGFSPPVNLLLMIAFQGILPHKETENHGNPWT